MAIGLPDYCVFGVALLISASIGVYYRLTGGRQATNQEYLLGDKSQGALSVAFSLVASFASAISVLGNSGEAYLYGTHFFVINVAYFLSTLVTAYVYLPVFFKNNTISIYEYLERRFGMVARTVASLAFTFQMVLYMGIVLYAPALALEALTGMSQETSIFLIGFVCIFYSTIGGIKAVIATDFYQTFLMFGAIFAIIIVGAYEAGGFKEIWTEAEKQGRIQFSNFSVDPTERHSWYTVLIGGFLTHISLYAINQTQVQRYLSMKSCKAAGNALLSSCVILIALSLALAWSGLTIFHKYRNCDPIKSGRISSSDQLMPLYVMDTFSGWPGLSGLFVAGIFSASLSTISSALNSLAAVTLEDYIRPIYYAIYDKGMGNNHESTICKLLALVYGFVCVGVALLARQYSSVLQASLTIFGMIGGPLFGLFTLAIFVPMVGEKEAVAGFIAGVITSTYLGFGGHKPPSTFYQLPTKIDGCSGSFSANESSINTDQSTMRLEDYDYIFRISYLYYILIGFLICISVALISTIFTKKSTKYIDPDLFASFVSDRLIEKEARQLDLMILNTRV